jgi:DNA-binding NarL/FixJ family response regulator
MPAENHDRGTVPRTIRVAIVVGVRLYLDGLSAAFRGTPDFEFVAAGSEPGHAPELVRTRRADVVLLDVAGADGCAVVRAVRAACPGVRVVILGIEEKIDRVIPLLEAGATAYVTRDTRLEALIDVTRRAVDGEALCSPRVVASLAARLAELAQQREPTLPGAELTPREHEIVGLIDRGLSNKQIAGQLCIELATVKNHVHHILVKLRVERRGAAAASLRQPNDRVSSARSDSISPNASLA